MAESVQDRFATEFPNLYHFGPASNGDQINRVRAILSSDLIRALSVGEFESPKRRLGQETISTPLGSFILNDQQALKYGHVKDPNSLSESEFAYLLDQFTFFWPGGRQEPIEMGKNFCGRYLSRGDRLLRVIVDTQSFFRVNHPWRIFLSTCNSGAPRSNPHATTYRGYNTFQPLISYAGSVKDVKEVAVLGYARLPDFQLTESLNAAEYNI